VVVAQQSEEPEMSESWKSIGEVASTLQIPRWRLAYLIDRGALPTPSGRIPGRRLFSREDIANIRCALETTDRKRPDREIGMSTPST
jgi:DNA-binding transcriptional MerR regulator